MELVKRLFLEIPQFVAPKNLLLMDFWSDAEIERGRGASAVNQMAEMLLALREAIDHRRYDRTEQQIYEAPQELLQSDYDGVVILPPLGHDRETREVLSSLLVRQRAAHKAATNPQPLLTVAGGEASNDDALAEFWGSIPAPMIHHRELAGFLTSVVIAALPSSTAVTLVLPASLLGTHSTASLRETVQRECALRFILELGGGWPGVHQQLGFAVIGLDKGSSDDVAVRLFKTPTDQGTALEDVVGDFRQLCRQQGGTTQYGYVMRSGLPAKSTWLVEAHHPRWEQYLNELGEVGNVQLIGDLGSIRRPPAATCWSQRPTDWPALHARQITREGLIDFDEMEDVRYYPEEPGEDLRLRPGDILIRDIYAHKDPGLLRVASFPEVERSCYLGPHTLLFRFSDHVEPLVRQFLLGYLRSSEAASWIRSRATGMHLHVGTLKDLPAPIPDKNILSAFRNLHQSRDQFREWAEQLQDVQDRLFSFASLRDASQELFTISARAQQRVAAAKATETLSWRVRNLYPHPVAFRWRTMEIMETGGETRYLEILRCAEVCLAYTAVVGCALAEALGPEHALKSISGHAKALREKPGTGVTFWTWVSIIEELNSRRFRDLDPTTPFIEVTQIYGTNPDVKDAINGLMQKRNDASHGRAPSAFELDKALAAAEPEVEALFEGVDFLSRYPLRDITFARRIGRQQRGTYFCRDLVGDHPVPASCNVEFKGETPAQGLHVIDQHGRPHFIEPWLIRQRCSKCKHEETYVLDRYMRDGTIWFKSLEYGHELEANDRREELGAIGVSLPCE